MRREGESEKKRGRTGGRMSGGSERERMSGNEGVVVCRTQCEFHFKIQFERVNISSLCEYIDRCTELTAEFQMLSTAVDEFLPT